MSNREDVGWPISMSHRDWFVKQLSKSLDVEHSIVDRVIRHQFDSVVQAVQKNKSVEISGFGLIVWNEKRALKKVESMNTSIDKFKDLLSDADNDSDVNKFTEIIDDMLIRRKVLINRIYELNPNLRGVEEQVTSTRKVKRTDFTSGKREDGDLQ